MSSLRELELERKLKEGGKGDLRKPNREPQFRWTQAELDKAWKSLTGPVLGLAETLANLPDSLDAATEFQRVLPRDELTALAPMAPEQVLEFRRQLRTLWDNCDSTTWNAKVEKREPVMDHEAQRILDSWWLEFDMYNRARWTVHFPTGRIFPTFLNYHALYARVLFDNWTHLGICKGCKKYFLKPLRISLLCKDCHAYGNRQRQQELRDRRKEETKMNAARKSRKRA